MNKVISALLLLVLAAAIQAKPEVPEEGLAFTDTQTCSEVYRYSVKAGTVMFKNMGMDMDEFAEDMYILHVQKYGKIDRVSPDSKLLNSRVALLFFRENIMVFHTDLIRFDSLLHKAPPERVIAMAAERMHMLCVSTPSFKPSPFRKVEGIKS